MFSKTKPVPPGSYDRLSDLRGSIEAIWKPALEHLGLVRVGADSRGNLLQSVKDEVDSIMDYKKQTCFWRGSSDDKKVRRMFVADYASKHFTDDSLGRIIIPSDTFAPRAIRNLALTYKYGATRSHTSNADKFEALMHKSTINASSKLWSRLYTLTDYAAVMPVVNEEAGQKTLDFNVIGPDESRVRLDANGNMTAFAYLTTRYDSEGAMLETVIAIWTATQYYWINASGNMGTFGETEENPYGEIPVALFASNPKSPYQNGGRTGLTDACIHANYLKILTTEDAAFAALGVWFGVNVNADEQTIIGPQVPIFAEVDRPDIPTPSLEYIKGEPHSEMLDALRWSEEKRAMLNEGISPALLMREATELSGTALRNLSRETMEQREDDADIMEAGERRLYRKIAVVCNMDMNAGLDVSADGFTVSFDDPAYIDDRKAEYDLDKEMMIDGYISPVEMYRKWKGDIDDEKEILARIEQNKLQAGSITKAKGGLAAAIAALSGAQSGGVNEPPTA